MVIFRQYSHYLALIALLTVASLLLHVAADVKVSGSLPVKPELPAGLGQWKGEDVYFCQNDQCLRNYSAGELNGSKVCKFCGGTLVQTWSLGEKNLLPADTVLLRKQYRDDSAASMMVTVVISGSEITSIHRPQMCLVGQGHQIVGQEKVEVPLPGRASLPVRILQLSDRSVTARDSSAVERTGVYAYWFAGNGRETDSNFARTFYTLFDRVLRGSSSRWAYIAVTTTGIQDRDSFRREIVRFVQALYPAIINSDYGSK